MKVIIPTEIRDSSVGPITSNVLENEYPVWSAAYSYPADYFVIVPDYDDHHIYRSLQANNVGHNPKTSPTWWKDYGADNRYAMFDTKVGSSTYRPDNITVSLKPGLISGLGLMQLEAQSVDVTMVNGTDTVYSQHIPLDRSVVSDLWAYFFEPPAYKKSLVLVDLPWYPNATLTVSINNLGSYARCGVMAFGRLRHIGDLQWNPSIEIADYSKKVTDPDFGTTDLKQGEFKKRMNCAVDIDNESVDEVFDDLASLRSVLGIWYGSDVFDVTTIYGFYNRCTLMIPGFSGSTFDLEIEGFI